MDKLSLAKRMVLGGAVGDAATLALHWHYDTDALRELLGAKATNPEFFTPMATKFYSAKDFPGHYSNGQVSCYGEQALMTLEYFQSTNGKFEGGESFSQFLFKWFNESTGRKDHPTKLFLEKAEPLAEAGKPLFPEAGADDFQTMFTFKVPVIYLALDQKVSEDEYLKAVEEATIAHQNHPVAIDFAKGFAIMLKAAAETNDFQQVLEKLVADDRVSDDVKRCAQWAFDKRAKAVFDANGWDSSLKSFVEELSGWLVDEGLYKTDDPDKARKTVGLTCAFPGSFMASVKIIGDTLETVSAADFKKEAFSFATRRNILFGGDNCGRCFTIQPLLVVLGAEIPEGMAKKFSEMDKLVQLMNF